MKLLKETVLWVLALASPVAVEAQDRVELSVGADVVSSYIWRGQDCGNAAVQPSIALGYKGLSLGAWGSYGIVDSNDAKEMDLTLSYSVGGLTIGVTDYWFNNCDETRYFKYAAHNTAHSFEANLGYDFGPVALSWNTFFAGNTGVTEKGDHAYASYVEVSAPFKVGGLDCEAAIGATPYDAGGMYADNRASGFAVQNVSVKASKDIKITPSFSLPLFGQVVANPSSQKAYLVVGVTL